MKIRVFELVIDHKYGTKELLSELLHVYFQI